MSHLNMDELRGASPMYIGKSKLTNENQPRAFLCVLGPVIPLQGKERSGAAYTVPLPL